MNPYTLLAESLDSDNDTTVTQTAAAATAGSTLGNTYATPAPPLTMTNQLTLAMQSPAVNQQAMSQHMATMRYHENQPSLQPCAFTVPHTRPFQMPPTQNLQIPAQGHFNPGPPPFNTGG
jgi:hypothetical protein